MVIVNSKTIKNLFLTAPIPFSAVSASSAVKWISILAYLDDLFFLNTPKALSIYFQILFTFLFRHPGRPINDIGIQYIEPDKPHYPPVYGTKNSINIPVKTAFYIRLLWATGS
jgi:hypothetical protein